MPNNDPLNLLALDYVGARRSRRHIPVVIPQPGSSEIHTKVSRRIARTSDEIQGLDTLVASGHVIHTCCIRPLDLLTSGRRATPCSPWSHDKPFTCTLLVSRSTFPVQFCFENCTAHGTQVVGIQAVHSKKHAYQQYGVCVS